MRTAPLTRSLLAAALCLASALPAGAQPVMAATSTAEARPWSSLSPTQRTTLAPLQKDWASIDGVRQRKWLELAARFPGMTAEEQQRVRERMQEWARMSPEERGRARLQFLEARQISGAERQALWEAYQALPPEQRRELAKRAEPGKRPATPTMAASAPTTKSSIVRVPPSAPVLKPVAPTVVQAAPGATTTSVARPPAPPLHQQPGLPKMAATPTFVDKNTLLPKRGAQGAATTRPAAATSTASAPLSEARP